MRTTMATLVVPALATAAALLMFAGCGDKDDDSGASLTAACALAVNDGCPECYDGEVTCTYEEQSATAGSCGECQPRAALYQQLCDAGVDDAEDDILSGTVCSDPL